MPDFNEDNRFPDNISYGSKGGPVFNTTIGQVKSGRENRNINWDYPLHRYDAKFGVRSDEDMAVINNFYMAMFGSAYGFRYKDWHDYKSVSIVSTTSPLDCTLSVITSSATPLVQIQKQYTVGPFTMTRPITKPVVSTVSVAVGGVEIVSSWVSVIASSGHIRVQPPNESESITNITQDDNGAVITTASPFIRAAGDSVYIQNVSGMTEVNDTRWLVTAYIGNDEFRIEAQSSAYGAYINSGTVRTRLVSAEYSTITGGFEFDVPCRFESDVFDVMHEAYTINDAEIPIVEIRI